MQRALCELLEENEVLDCPIYATLLGKGNEMRFGFFGLTQQNLLIALLHPLDASVIEWTAKVPLDIKAVDIHRSFIPYQSVVTITFHEGDPYKLRICSKLLASDFIDQKDNVSNFLKQLQAHRTPA